MGATATFSASRFSRRLWLHAGAWQSRDKLGESTRRRGGFQDGAEDYEESGVRLRERKRSQSVRFSTGSGTTNAEASKS